MPHIPPSHALVCQLENDVNIRRGINSIAVTLCRIEPDLLGTFDCIPVQTMTKTAQHLKHMCFTSRREEHPQQNLAFDLERSRLFRVLWARFELDLNRDFDGRGCVLFRRTWREYPRITKPRFLNTLRCRIRFPKRAGRCAAEPTYLNSAAVASSAAAGLTGVRTPRQIKQADQWSSHLTLLFEIGSLRMAGRAIRDELVHGEVISRQSRGFGCRRYPLIGCFDCLLRNVPHYWNRWNR